ncbi:MAG: biotin/lipoyl-binding carrier protein [Euzebyales bacterium]|nr:biotin/lipoyl-binding carrier protein [Euzebyales bacterium]
MVASVAAVRVGPGRRVARGDTLLLVESMKMEIPVLAPAAGTVVEVRVAAADIVQEGDVLVLLDVERV